MRCLKESHLVPFLSWSSGSQHAHMQSSPLSCTVPVSSISSEAPAPTSTPPLLALVQYCFCVRVSKTVQQKARVNVRPRIMGFLFIGWAVYKNFFYILLVQGYSLWLEVRSRTIYIMTGNSVHFNSVSTWEKSFYIHTYTHMHIYIHTQSIYICFCRKLTSGNIKNSECSSV